MGWFQKGIYEPEIFNLLAVLYQKLHFPFNGNFFIPL